MGLSVSPLETLLDWALPFVEKKQPEEVPEVVKVENTAASFFDSLHTLFYGEKLTLPSPFLPLAERVLATTSAVGYFCALSLGVAGFAKVSLLTGVLSTATFFGSAGMAQAKLQTSLANSASKFEEQNNRLEGEVNRLSTLNDQLTKTAASLENTSVELKKTNADLQYTNQCLTSQVDRFAEENQKLSSEVSRFASLNQQLEGQVQNLGTEVTRFTHENQHLTQAISDFEAQLKRFTAQNEQAAENARKHQEQMSELLKKNEAHTTLGLSIIETLAKQLGAFEANGRSFCERIREGDAERLQELSRTITSALDTSTLGQKINDLAMIKVDIAEATKGLLEIETRVKIAMDLLSSYEARGEQQRKVLEELENRHQDLLRRYEELTNRLGAHVETLEAASSTPPPAAIPSLPRSSSTEQSGA